MAKVTTDKILYDLPVHAHMFGGGGCKIGIILCSFVSFLI